MAKKKNNDELQPYTEYLEHLSRNHDRSGVFNDFLTMIVCTLSMQQKEGAQRPVLHASRCDENDGGNDRTGRQRRPRVRSLLRQRAVFSRRSAGEPRDQLRRRGHHGGMLQDDARKRLPERHRRGGLPHGLAPYGDLALLAYRKASGLAPAIYQGAPSRTTGFGTRKRRCESGRRINEIFLLFFHFPLTSRTSFR